MCRAKRLSMPADVDDDLEVEVIVAVHTATRPIARAVDSVLAGTSASCRVTVVAHNIDPHRIASNLGDRLATGSVRLLSLGDDISSPAGPLNLGLDAATAPFVCVIGSDDTFDPGAVDSWLALQRRSDAAMVLARIRHHDGKSDSYPPVRPGRRTGLDGVKDRLSYRSAPLGLISRRHFGTLRFSEGLQSGEDLAYVSRMWFSGLNLAFDSSGPAYVVHHDEHDRVTSAPRAVTVDFAFLDEIYPSAWFAMFTIDQRVALAVKFIRLHVFDAILARENSATWSAADQEALAGVVSRIIATAPQVENVLSRADRDVVDAVLAGASPAVSGGLVRRRWNYRSVSALLPRNPLRALDRQAPFRTLSAGAILARIGDSGPASSIT